MGVPRGTTPTLILTLPRVDVTQAVEVLVTFACKGLKMTKVPSNITYDEEKSELSVSLSQQETLRLNGATEIQVNWIYADGSRAASNVATYTFTQQLLERVIM